MVDGWSCQCRGGNCGGAAIHQIATRISATWCDNGPQHMAWGFQLNLIVNFLLTKQIGLHPIWFF